MLWVRTFYQVLKEPFNSYAKLIVDNTLVLASAKTISDLKNTAYNNLTEVVQRINSHGLEIIPNKTEVVIFTYRYKFELPKLMLCGDLISLSSEMTYLDVTIDKSLLS